MFFSYSFSLMCVVNRTPRIESISDAFHSITFKFSVLEMRKHVFLSSDPSLSLVFIGMYDGKLSNFLLSNPTAIIHEFVLTASAREIAEVLVCDFHTCLQVGGGLLHPCLDALHKQLLDLLHVDAFTLAEMVHKKRGPCILHLLSERYPPVLAKLIQGYLLANDDGGDPEKLGIYRTHFLGQLLDNNPDKHCEFLLHYVRCTWNRWDQIVLLSPGPKFPIWKSFELAWSGDPKVSFLEVTTGRILTELKRHLVAWCKRSFLLVAEIFCEQMRRWVLHDVLLPCLVKCKGSLSFTYLASDPYDALSCSHHTSLSLSVQPDVMFHFKSEGRNKMKAHHGPSMPRVNFVEQWTDQHSNSKCLCLLSEKSRRLQPDLGTQLWSSFKVFE